MGVYLHVHLRNKCIYDVCGGQNWTLGILGQELLNVMSPM